MLFDSSLSLLEHRLSHHLRPSDDNELFAAARYAALGEGKRIRPRLCMEVGLALGAPLSSLLDPACALELVHTSSLIHDDLPCMDDDDYRRGKPSLHKVYGEAHALLTGDFLLVYPFEILSEATLPSSIKCQLISFLAKKIGAKGMILGQHLDLSIPSTSSGEEIETMYLHKTADLIDASFQAGAIIAMADPYILEQLEDLAETFGIAYQIHNDLIDHSDLCGRSLSSDDKNEKRTLCRVLGRKRTEEYLETLVQEILSYIKEMRLEIPIVQEVCHRFMETLAGIES